MLGGGDKPSKLLYKEERSKNWTSLAPFMALTQRLQLRQSQALVMTPQLMQAIKLLQLSNLDLVAYVEAELERNPLLDSGAENERRRPHPMAPNRPTSLRPTARRGTAASPRPAAIATKRGRKRPSTTAPSDDAEPIRPRTSDLPGGYSEWAGVGSGGRDDGDYNLESFVSAETTLADWLREQLTLAIADPVAAHDRAISHRSGRRGRLSQRRSRRGGGKARHQHGRNRSRA